MLRKGMTIKEAAQEWVREMNSYPEDMIDTLMESDRDAWEEVTMPCVGNRVYVYGVIEGETCSAYGEIESIEDDIYIISMDDGNTVRGTAEGFEVQRDGYLPMWGWMWSLSDSVDKEWMEEHGGIKKMSECGFRIYEHREWGYFFGIDGVGYDFYEQHWIPAYKARGLKWHDHEMTI